MRKKWASRRQTSTTYVLRHVQCSITLTIMICTHLFTSNLPWSLRKQHLYLVVITSFPTLNLNTSGLNKYVMNKETNKKNQNNTRALSCFKWLQDPGFWLVIPQETKSTNIIMEQIVSDYLGIVTNMTNFEIRNKEIFQLLTWEKIR